MNTFNFRQTNSGIGLIEVLITTVVIAVGLLAVASLQGNLIGGSRDNKTRAEAKALADSKIEELRDTVVKTGFDALASSPSPESIGGVTENFNRSWVITDQTSPERKHVSITVCWPAGACTDNVIVQSEIAYDDVGNAAKNLKDAQTAGTTLPGGPSTNAESSDEITETKELPDGDPGTYVQDTADQNKIWIRADSRIMGEAAYVCSSLNVNLFENDLYTRRVNHDGISGNEAIELYEKVTIDEVAYCIPRIRFNGGVIIPIRGTVHSGATASQHSTTYLDVNLFTFNASETGAYCVFKPETGAKSAPYTCYVGGNCTGFTCSDSTPCNDDDVTKCPTGDNKASAIVGPGGWRGKVGLLGIAGPSNDFRNVCFQEEIASAPATLDTARNYYSLRNNINEGINKPYSCHDFLIINGQQTLAKIHSECVDQANAIGGFTLTSKNIVRTIASGNNIYDPVVDTSSCVGSTGTAYSITGTIAGISDGTPTVTVTDGATTNTCLASSTSYTCAITTTTNSLTIAGVYNNQPVSCILAPPSNSGCTLTFATLPEYTITGHLLGGSLEITDEVILEVNDGVNSVPCVKNDDYENNARTYTCTISTASTTGVVINATAPTGYAVLPDTYDLGTLSGTTSSIVVPTPTNDFVVSLIPSHTVSGNITLDNKVSLESLTVGVTYGGCGLTAPGSGIWSTNSTGSYTCIVYIGTDYPNNNLTFTISPPCSNKKYGISASSGESGDLGSGRLTISVTNLISDVTKNISVYESSTNCK